MKTNGKSNGHGRLKGQAGDQYHKTWANYFVKFLQAYEANGIEFWAITMQNEPIMGLINNAKWQQTAWTPQAQRDFLKQDLYPAIDAYNSDRSSPVEIILLDDQRVQLPWWVEIVMEEGNDQLENINTIGMHWYWDDYIPPRVLDMTRRKYPDKLLLGTEACNKLNGQSATEFLGSWEHGENYSKSILQDIAHGASGWVDWNMALNEDGKPNWAGNSDDSPIIVNSTAGEFYKNPAFYHLGHFSKFVDENWVVLDGKIESIRDQPYGYVVFQSPLATSEISRVVVVLN